MPLNFFNPGQALYNKCNVMLEQAMDTKEKLPILLKKIHVCIQLGQLELNKVNSDTAIAYAYYKSAVAAYDVLKEAFSELNYPEDADAVLKRIQTSLGEALKQQFEKDKTPPFKITYKKN